MKLLNSLFHDFHAKDVLYCHWKSTEHLDATFKGKTDVDVLVSIKDRTKCESILIGTGFKRFETNFFRMYPGIYDYLGYDEECGFIHFHLHYMLNLGDRWVKASNVNNVEELLKRRVWSEHYLTFTVNPKDELFLLDLRMFLKHGRGSYKDNKILQERNWIINRIESNEDLTLAANVEYLSYPRFSRLSL
jgi:hypothetical protein